ncbi:MAG: 2-hydroxychromene-2-carboxylate isomerase [Alphaproteobacteria bacterium]
MSKTPGSKTVEYFFCLNSPWVYLGQKRLAEIAAEAGATVAYRPVDLKAMMLALFGDNDPPERSELHQRYGKRDIARWADFYELPINGAPRFYPVSQSLAARVVIAATRLGADAAPLVLALPRAVWAEDRDIADRETLTAIAEECGLPGDILIQAAADPSVEETLLTTTEEALSRGVFGIPTYVYDDEIFWGQDRLDFLARALA